MSRSCTWTWPALHPFTGLSEALGLLPQMLGGQVLQLPRGQRRDVPAPRRVALVRLSPGHPRRQQRQRDGLPLPVDLHAHHGPATAMFREQGRQQGRLLRVAQGAQVPRLNLRDVAAAAAAQLRGLAGRWSGKTVESTSEARQAFTDIFTYKLASQTVE